MVREWGAEEPGTCSSVAQVDISSHEVSSQTLPPFFPAPGNLLQAQGDGKEKKRNIFPLPLKLSMPWSLKGRRGRCGCCNCKEQVLPILIFSF